MARFRLHLVKHRSQLKNRIHSTLINFGVPCPVSDLFGVKGRELLDHLELPDPWRRNVDASLKLINQLEGQIATIAAEIGDINRFSTPTKPTGYTGLCPRVSQSLRRPSLELRYGSEAPMTPDPPAEEAIER